MTQGKPVLRAKPAWRRHWEASRGRWSRVAPRTWLLATLVAAAGTFLVVPRPTRPTTLPLPTYDAAAAAVRDVAERERAVRARQQLSKRARLIGELVRRVGLEEATGPGVSRATLDRLRREVAQFRSERQDQELLDLRALQAELFVEAVQRFLVTGQVDSHLQELGGSFHRLATSSWIHESQSLLTDSELRLLFRMRWGQLTGTYREPPFGPSLNEFRRYYDVFLRLPEGGLIEARTATALRRASYAEALGRIDPEYPVQLARGICLLWAEHPEPAGQALALYLETHPRGPWSHSARNFLASAQLAAKF